MTIERNTIHHGDNLELMKLLPDNSIDVILTDPPYLYLKNQKLDRQFDERAYFNECKRVLKKNGFIILFGRGSSFYRWNYILADKLGFIFKEEIVWDKCYCTSPLMALSRMHETISIFCKGKGKILKNKVPYIEMKGHDIAAIKSDIKRLLSQSLNNVLDFLEKNEVSENTYTSNNLVTTSKSMKNIDRCVSAMQCIEKGMNEKSIIRTDYLPTSRPNNVACEKSKPTGDRCTNVMQSIEFGMNEKSIIKERREHYNTIHPTQKPPRLLERLLALVCKPTPEYRPLVLDTFAGSCNTAKACINYGCDYICMEIDKQFYDDGVENVEKHKTEKEAVLF